MVVVVVREAGAVAVVVVVVVVVRLRPIARLEFGGRGLVLGSDVPGDDQR